MNCLVCMFLCAVDCISEIPCRSCALWQMCAKWDKKKPLLIDFAPRESSAQSNIKKWKNMIWILKLVPSSIYQMYQTTSKQSRSNSLYRPTWILKFGARGIECINTTVTSTCQGLQWVADEVDECSQCNSMTVKIPAVTSARAEEQECWLGGAISIFVSGSLSSNTCKFKPAQQQQTITLMLFTPNANEE